MATLKRIIKTFFPHILENKLTSVFHKQNELMEAAQLLKHTYEAEELANRLVEEEYKEFTNTYYIMNSATTYEERAHTVKEAIDLIYVTCQYLNATIGPDKAEKAFNIVHENNMLKVGSKKREDGKLLKPEGLPSAEEQLMEIL